MDCVSLDAIKEMESEQTGRILANAMNMDSLRQVTTDFLSLTCRCHALVKFPEYPAGYHSIDTTIQHESHAHFESIDPIEFITHTTI